MDTSVHLIQRDAHQSGACDGASVTWQAEQGDNSLPLVPLFNGDAWGIRPNAAPGSGGGNIHFVGR